MQAQIKSENDSPAVGEAPSVTGYVDAVTGTRLYGWAWDPQRPAARIAIQLEAQGSVVGRLVADRLREDLKASGVGDGAHAFEVEAPDGVPPHELHVLAVCPAGGGTIELARRGAAVEGGASTELREGLQALARSQRFIHRNLQSLMMSVAELRRAAAEPAGGGEVEAIREAETAAAAANRAAVEEALETLEAAIYRFDQTLRDQVVATKALRRDRGDAVARVLAGIAAVLAGSAFLAIVLH